MENIAGLLFQVILFVGVFYFLLIRPQKKKISLHQKMISDLKLGDKVITAGGIIGKIKKIDDNIFVLEISEKNEIKVLKSYILGKE